VRTLVLVAIPSAVAGAAVGAVWMLWELANPDRGKNCV
jgi:hypothetical protein